MAIITDGIFLVVGALVGSAITIAICLIIDAHYAKKHDEWITDMREALTGSDFCEVGCGYYEECFRLTADRELAMDDLYNNHCYNCPIKMATDLLEKGE